MFLNFIGLSFIHFFVGFAIGNGIRFFFCDFIKNNNDNYNFIENNYCNFITRKNFTVLDNILFFFMMFLIGFIGSSPTYVYYHFIEKYHILKNNFLKINCFYILYLFYGNKTWSLCIDLNNNIGNIAFPDNSALYYVSFLTFQNIHITGKIPNNICLYSITFYDTSGKVIRYYDDTNIIKINEENEYDFDVKYLVGPYAIVLRIYRNNNYISEYNDKPIIKMIELANSSNIDKKYDIDRMSDRLFDRLFDIDNCSKKELILNTKNFKNWYTYLMSFRNKIIYCSFLRFSFPLVEIDSFFPNVKASYLCLNIYENKPVIKISILNPCIDPNVRYFSFMACNFLTTQTDDCIGSNDFEEKCSNETYVIYVSTSHKNACDNGYDKNDKNQKLLLWDNDNKNPIIIYREIRSDYEGLMKKNINDPEKLMGKYYPKIEFIQKLSLFQS